jgi:DNA invertase Pin-like site-specific DNA recombinase
MNNQKYTILYERLSVEDDDREGESNSIANQEKFPEEYAEKNGLTPYRHVQDDGYSGVNFSRPGFQEMAAEVQAGNVSACVVRDMSRFGRNYLQVGFYMELFEQAGTRIIAVNDNVDTLQGIDDFTPFRNIINEWYARDTSRKVKSGLQTKGHEGKPLATKPPYGFYKDPADPNHWLVDAESAAVVRRVFDLTINGKGPFEICRILHDDGIERPSYYQTKRGYVNYSGALEAADPCLWGTHIVTFMLARPEYAGHTVNFRSVKPSYKSKKQIKLPKEEWLIFENTHEPIVSQEVWDLAQKCREVVRRPNSLGEANPLTGLLYCAECGKRLYNHRSRKDHYTCSGYTQGRQKFQETHCSPHCVTTEALRKILLEVIQKTSGYVREYEADFAERVRQSSTLKQGETVKTHTRQIAKNERRIAELDKLFTSVYEDKVKGVLSEERFALMSSGYEREQADLREKNEELRAELDAFNADEAKADNFIALVRKYTRIEELTPLLINEFVEKIVVHESVWSEQTETERRKGTRSQQIDVYLKYIGSFDAPDTRAPEEIEAERIAEEKLQRQRAWKRDYERRKREEKRVAKAAEADTAKSEAASDIPKPAA